MTKIPKFFVTQYIFSVLSDNTNVDLKISTEWNIWIKWCVCTQIHLQYRGPGFNPWVWKILEEGNGNLLQYSCLENPMDQRSLVGYSPWGFRVENDWLTNTCAHTYTCIYILSYKDETEVNEHAHIYVCVCIYMYIYNLTKDI